MDLKENFIFRPQQKSFLKYYILTGFLNLISSDDVWKLLELVCSVTFTLPREFWLYLEKMVTHDSLTDFLKLVSRTLYRRTLGSPYLFACVIFLLWLKICIFIIHITNINQKPFEGLSFANPVAAAVACTKMEVFKPIRHVGWKMTQELQVYPVERK